jgi:ribosomal protein S20
MIKKLQDTESRDEAAPLLSETKAYLDQLATRGIIHRNKAAHHKGRLERHVNSLG